MSSGQMESKAVLQMLGKWMGNEGTLGWLGAQVFVGKKIPVVR